MQYPISSKRPLWRVLDRARNPQNEWFGVLKTIDFGGFGMQKGSKTPLLAPFAHGNTTPYTKGDPSRDTEPPKPLKDGVWVLMHVPF